MCESANDILISLQVRAVNEYGLTGNWSEAFVTDIPIQINPTPSPTPPSSSEIPSWVYIVIALVVMAVLILVLVVVAVFVVRRYCFHRYSIKTVSHLSALAITIRWTINHRPHHLNSYTYIIGSSNHCHKIIAV